MSDTEMILERLVTAIGALAAPRPVIPLNVALWDIETIAEYLKRDANHVRTRVACIPGFPQIIRLPGGKGRAHPLYRAAEVMAWAEKHREGKPS